VGQIDQVHNAEHERQSRRQQEQQQAELKAVESLFDKERHLSEAPRSARLS
jgi:hypothetical protein